jgi:hypothetical protein
MTLSEEMVMAMRAIPIEEHAQTMYGQAEVVGQIVRRVHQQGIKGEG